MSASDLYFDSSSLHAMINNNDNISMLSTSRSTSSSSSSSASSSAPPSGPLLVSYQGEPGAYSELAVHTLFGPTTVGVAHPQPCSSFSLVFDSIANGSAHFGLIPIENSLGGSIHDNLDLLLRHKVAIVAEIQIKVKHCLLALPGVTLSELTTAYSHPQALAQCESYLASVGLAPVKQSDTAGSARMVADLGRRDVCAVASELAGRTYGLEVVARNIADDEENYTRFLLLTKSTTHTQQAMLYTPIARRESVSASSASSSSSSSASAPAAPLHPNVCNLHFSPSLSRTSFKTSLVLTLPDTSGALFKALSVFALRELQLCKLESRPCKAGNFLGAESSSSASAGAKTVDASAPSSADGASPFQYLFFMDALSSLGQSEALKNAIRHLREYAPFLRVLGSYPTLRQASTSTSVVPSASSSAPVAAGASVALSEVASPSPSRGARVLKIGIVGFGSFGQFLAKTFVRQGHSVFAYSRSDYSSLSASLGVSWIPEPKGFGRAGVQVDVLILSMSILSFASSVSSFPWAEIGSCLVVDVLSVKVHPREILTAMVQTPALQNNQIDLLCTHPMFGPESGRHSWNSLPFMYDPVLIRDFARLELFLACFRVEGCQILEMSCAVHDAHAAESQFLTHTTGRVLGFLGPKSTPINTSGYTKLLQVVEQTQKDSWELYAGLYKYNVKAQEQLDKFGESFDAIRSRLIAESKPSPSTSASSSSSSSGSAVAFNARVSSMSESRTAAVADLATKMSSDGSGLPVTSLSVGEILSVPAPGNVVAAAIAALSSGKTTYTPSAGLASLRRKICTKLRNENGLSYNEDNVIVSNGAKQSIVQAILALVCDGDEVLIPAPYWTSYPEMAKLAGGVPVVVETTAAEGFVLSAQKLQEAITTKTKVLILCSPSNPTGTVYSRDQLLALVAVLEKHPRIIVISDEIYEYLLFDGAAHHSFASLSSGMFSRTITVNGFSKGAAMTGFRVGYAACPDQSIVDQMNKVQSQLTSCASSISQHAALAALDLDDKSEYRVNMIATIARARGVLLAVLDTIPNISYVRPTGAFYVLLDVSKYFGKNNAAGETIDDCSSLARWLLSVHRLAVVPGSAFGSPSTIRLSYAGGEDVALKGGELLKRALEQLE